MSPRTCHRSFRRSPIWTFATHPGDSEYSFSLRLRDSQSFSSRVISDGTLRLLALVTILNDPRHGGVLCWEEPENGVHEARIPELMQLIRNAAGAADSQRTPSYFQILLNTHCIRLPGDSPINTGRKWA